MQKVYAIRMDDGLQNDLEAAARRAGKDATDLIKEMIYRAVHPAPAPAPQPVPQPAPQPVPQPAPQPAPAPGELPYALEKRVRDLSAFWVRVDHPRNLARINLWWPKVLAVLAMLAAAFAYNTPASLLLMGVAALAVIGDVLWKGRAVRSEIMEHALTQLESLIASVPVLYARLCLSKPPEQAAAEVLGLINEQVQRLGEMGVKDVGVEEWGSQPLVSAPAAGGSLAGARELQRPRVLEYHLSRW